MNKGTFNLACNGVKLALFDMDGTLFESRLDWPWIRKQLNIHEGETILESIYLNNRVDKERLQILETYERENTVSINPIKGAREFVTRLKESDVTVVLITNNNLENTCYLLDKFNMSFHLKITREQQMWKPSPAAFNHVMKRFDFKPSETIAFGDSHYDIAAAQSAGVSHTYIIADSNSEQPQYPDVTYFIDYSTLALTSNVDMSTTSL